MAHILVLGSCGYVGSLLCPRLLNLGYRVTGFDVCWFGSDFMPFTSPGFRLIEGDIRDIDAIKAAMAGVDVVINLACVSNDASFELDEALSTEINLDAFEPLVLAAKEAGVKRFIYASSSSVYGISSAPDVREDHPLVPITLYNRYKAACESILFRHCTDSFTCVAVRPATICGRAPRQRLDLVANIFAAQAWFDNEVIVLGGQQTRPSLHIMDMCRFYEALITAPKDMISGEVFNCSKENLTVYEIARLAAFTVDAIKRGDKERNKVKITVRKSKDPRSYRVNSEKMRSAGGLGFMPLYDTYEAIEELCSAFGRREMPTAMIDSVYRNVEHLKKLGVK